MRIDDRVPEKGRDAILELVGQNVLEDLGLVVDRVPRHAQRLREVGLEQAVMADDLEGDLATGRGQVGAPVGGVGDEPHPLEPLQHVGGRRRRHIHLVRDRARRDRIAGRSLVLELADALEVVLGRRRGLERRVF